MTKFAVVTDGPITIYLKKYNELYEVIRPETRVHNYIVGTAYLWHHNSL